MVSLWGKKIIISIWVLVKVLFWESFICFLSVGLGKNYVRKRLFSRRFLGKSKIFKGLFFFSWVLVNGMCLIFVIFCRRRR